MGGPAKAPMKRLAMVWLCLWTSCQAVVCGAADNSYTTVPWVGNRSLMESRDFLEGAETGLEYHVSIGKPCYPGRHFCSGVLISQQWVLTAASCIQHLDFSAVSVHFRLGGLNISEIVSSEDQILHPNWTGSRADGNDIGLLKLHQPLKGLLEPVALPHKSLEVLQGPFLEVLKYTKQGIKQVTHLAIVPIANCDEMRQEAHAGVLTKKIICGFAPQLQDPLGLNGGLLILTNDSTAGITVQRSDYVLGIASFDRADRFGMDENLPILFTRVISFRDWIVSVLNNASMVNGGMQPQADHVAGDCSSLGTTGSEAAPQGRFPYAVSLRNRQNVHFCVGILVHPLWVLAPAHCLENEAAGDRGKPLLYIGAHNLSEENVAAKVHRTTQVRIHPSWNKASRRGLDIALFRLDFPTTDVPVPRLVNDSMMFSDTAVFSTIVWRAGAQPDGRSIGLQYGDLHLVLNADCQQLHNATILDSMVCAVGATSDFCEGGVAGPLLLVNAPNDIIADGAPHLDHIMGMISHVAAPCSEPQTPLVFTRISSIVDWIDSITEASPEEQRELDNALIGIARAPENESTEKTVSELLAMGADPDACCLNTTQGLALHAAAQSGNGIVAAELLAAGADIDARDIVSRNTALHEAAKENSTKVVKVLVNAGASLGQPNDERMTPLHFAARQGNAIVARLFVSVGARPDELDLRQDTPLHFAASVDAAVLAGVLINAGADVNAINNNMQGPLHVAASSGSAQVAELLVRSGADQSVQDSFGATPADAICTSPFSSCSSEDIQELETVLGQSVDPSELSEPDQELLALAARPISGKTQMAVDQLLSQRADVDACCNTFGGTALHETANSDNYIVASALVAAGADVNAVDNDFWNTPLHYAVQRNATQVLQVLLSAGANVNAANFLGERPLHIAALWGNAAPAMLLLNETVDVNARDAADETPLHIAARKNSTSVAKELIKSGSDINAENFHGDTPLHISAAHGSFELTGMLVQAGSNRSHLNTAGELPVSVLCKRNFLGKCSESMRRLLRALLQVPHTTSVAASLLQSVGYIASLRDVDGVHRCIGTLVHPLWVLSSTSCLKRFGGSKFDVNLGVRNTENKGVEILQVNATSFIEDFDGAGFASDLALLKLEEPSQFRPVELPTMQADGTPQVNELLLNFAIVITLSKTGEGPQAMYLAFVPNEDCNIAWQGLVQQNMWCAFTFGGQNCPDEGAPLIVSRVPPGSDRTSNSPTLVGIASFGSLCQENRSLPGVFTNAVSFEPLCWITETIEGGTLDSCVVQPDRKPESDDDDSIDDRTIAVITVLGTGSFFLAVVIVMSILRKDLHLQQQSQQRQHEIAQTPEPPPALQMDFPSQERISSVCDGTTGSAVSKSPGLSPFVYGSPFHADLLMDSASSLKVVSSDLDICLNIELTGHKVGRGAFALVEEAVYIDNEGRRQRAAVKRLGPWCLPHLDQAVNALKSELEVLLRVPAHPNIVKCYGGKSQLHELDADGIPNVFLVEELMYTNLHKLIHRDEPNTRGKSNFVYSTLLHIFDGVVAGLKHLHSNGVVHYDLKPANILLDEDFNAKLADFGCSKVKIQSYATAHFAGTLVYMAPECWFGNYHQPQVRPDKIDIYSLGVVMWECVSGVSPEARPAPPFVDVPNLEASAAGPSIKSTEVITKWRFALDDAIPAELRDLIWNCLAFEYHQRPNVIDVAERLQDMLSASWVNSFVP